VKRKALKISIIVVSVLAAILIIIALIISPVAKNYIEKHSKELIGRKVLIKDLHINIFTGTLELDSIRMYEANDKAVFASIDTFFVNLELTKLLGKNIEISQLKVAQPYLVVLQNGNTFNFDDLMPKKDTTNVESSKSSFPKSVVIRDINLHGGILIYTDQQLKNSIKMNELAVSIPEISFGKGNTRGGVHLKVGDKATIDSKLEMNMETKEYKLNLLVKELAINIVKPYMQEYFNIRDFEGLAGGDLLVAGKTEHIMDFNVSGTGNLKNFNMTNSDGEPLLAAETASMKIDNINKTTSTYLFEYIHASNARLDYIMHPDPKPNNFMAIFKPDNHSDTVKSKPMTFKVKELHVDNSQVNFTDKTMKPAFTLPIKKVDFLATNFDMYGENSIQISGEFPGSGTMKFNWKGNRNDLSNQQIFMDFQNFSLKSVSPYCKTYTAYDITTGNMNFESKTSIRNNNINSSNTVDVYKMNVGNKHKELKAKYNVPLKFALYIMKDKDEKINFNLPVKGNTKDPKFSYSKIMWQTLVNLMVKVALSPVKFLAGTLGMNPDKMESIAINPLQTSFTAEQYSQLNDLASMVKKKPDMVLELTQFANLKDVLDDYALYKTKYAYLYSMPDTDKKNPFVYEEVQSIATEDKDFVDYVDSLLHVKGKTNLNLPVLQKTLSLYSPDSLQTELLNKFENRNSMLKNYMKTSMEISEKNLAIKTADKDTLKIFKDKAHYKINMSLPGAGKSN